VESIQQSVDLGAIAPEIVLAATACLVLVADLFLPREGKWLAMPLSAAGIFATLAAVVALIGDDRGTFAIGDVPTYVVNDFALVFKGLFCVLGLLVLAVSYNYFKVGRFYQGEYYFLMLCSLLGALIMASARDLVSIFIAIELITIPAIVMVALRKRNTKSNEAALKFFLFGVLSSALMLYGMSLVFGITGETTLTGIRESLVGRGDEPIVVLAIFFLLVGFGFKISAVPFHFWAPDTYEGAPAPVAAFLATVSKIGGFVGLMVLMFEAFPEVASSWRPLFGLLAALTMTLGNLVALRQQHIIRLLAYSGIAQAGYMLVPFALITTGNDALNAQALSAAIVYIIIYGLMDLGAFAVAIAFARRGGSYFISDYAGLWQRSPVLATMMAAFLLSLTGVPPMAGFMAKLFVFLAAVNAEVYWLAVVMGVNAVIAAFYYLFVVKKMFFELPVVTEPVTVPPMLRAAMGFAVVALLAVFIYPPLVTEFADRSVLGAGIVVDLISSISP
jgi:NADH-quinone oxidoreductase subunit N